MSDQALLLTQLQVLDRTRSWIHDNYLYMRPDASIRDDDPLLADGIIDSMGVIELVEHLQDTFSIAISDDEIIESNLGSIAAIGRFVHEKCLLRPSIQTRPLQVA